MDETDTKLPCQTCNHSKNMEIKFTNDMHVNLKQKMPKPHQQRMIETINSLRTGFQDEIVFCKLHNWQEKDAVT